MLSFRAWRESIKAAFGLKLSFSCLLFVRVSVARLIDVLFGCGSAFGKLKNEGELLEMDIRQRHIRDCSLSPKFAERWRRCTSSRRIVAWHDNDPSWHSELAQN
ncbi:hypothetical protein C8R43DRAFT_170157 [Mycena crocata]|nr:hypothetical protein C8R43DRAFT_170157 [Mycena crocata]